VLATWIPEKWDAVQYLFFYGPAGSGKTWALEVLASISFRPFMSASTTLPVIFRACDLWHPTLFLDETEVYLRKERSEIMHLLNAGYRKGFPATLNAIKSNFFLQRRTIARKMGNPRLLKIHLHTFRHFKGTTEYHKTKDIIHVQQILGHQDIKSTMMYIQIEQALFQNSMDDEFHVKVAKTEEEIKGLLEIGYEFILQKDGLAYFCKRK